MEIVKDPGVDKLTVKELEVLRFKVAMQLHSGEIDWDTFMRADIQIMDTIIKKKGGELNDNSH